MMTIDMSTEPVENTGPVFPTQDHRNQLTCSCVGRHLDEAVAAFDHGESLLKLAMALPDEQACEALAMLRQGAEFRLAAIREVRAAHFALHFDPARQDVQSAQH